jgi:hypothetical protein
MSGATLCELIREMIDDGAGWEDIFVALHARGYLRSKDGPALRRYVLGRRR